ncbi:19973_t:CDS:2, partial [Racocetra fulgida]
LDSDYMDEEMLRRVALRIDKYLKKKSYYESEMISSTDLNEKINCETFLTLMSHREKQIPEQLEKFKTIATNVFSDLELQNITQDELITYLCRFSCNNFNVDDMMYSIGQQTKDGPQILRSIENIKAGEEITISYVDVAMSRTSRQKLLREKYFFKCQCPRCCTDDISMDITEEERRVLVKIEQLTEKKDNEEEKEKIVENLLISQMQQNQMIKESISSFISRIIISLLPHLIGETSKADYIKTLEVFFNDMHTTITHPDLFTTSSLSLATRRFYDRIELQQWRESWTLGRYILAIYLLIYPRFHPIIGLHLFSLAKCMWNDTCKDKDKIVESYEIVKATKKVLEITHGDGFENRKIIAQVMDLEINMQIELMEIEKKKYADRCIIHRDPRSPYDNIRVLTDHKSEICGLKWNNEGNQLASGGNANELFIWEGLNLSPIRKLDGHKAAVRALSWSPHSRNLLVSGGGHLDRQIRFWNTLDSRCLASYNVKSQVCNLQWSPTANELVSTHGWWKNDVVVWQYPSMEKIATLKGHNYRVLYFSLSPNGEDIVTGAGGDDNTLRFWKVFNAPLSNKKKITKSVFKLDGLIR